MHANTERKPIIGMIAAANPKYFPNKHVTNTAYIDAIIAAGGTPILIPADADPARAAEYIPLLDGLLIPGGEDVTPALFGQDPLPSVTYVLEDKDRMEMALVRLATERGLPVFGICRGIQLMNVCFGGTLYQDLPTQVPGCMGHSQDSAIRSQLTHHVQVTPGSLMEELLGTEPLSVNSYHHQAVKDLAPGFTATVTAADGVIEAIEDPARNLYAVQWHPEELIVRHPRFLPLFRRLVELASRRAD